MVSVCMADTREGTYYLAAAFGGSAGLWGGSTQVLCWLPDSD